MIHEIDSHCKLRVIQVVRQLLVLKLNPLTQGNVSIRDPKSGLIAITPHDFPYDQMTEDDLVVMDLDGKVVEGHHKPSVETVVHRVVYSERPDINGIVHTEPIYTNAFGLLGMPIEPGFVNMAIDVGGAVPIMKFADSGNEAFAYRMLKEMDGRNAIVWACHGLLTIGASLEKAFHCTVMVEQGAQIFHLALCHGTPYKIDQSRLDLIIANKRRSEEKTKE